MAKPGLPPILGLPAADPLPPTIFPGTFEGFGRMVVPELPRRGLFRTDYAGRTLREDLQNPG